MSENNTPPLHFTQAYAITAKEKDLDFFDVNLEFDSKVFIDPFLIRRSPIEDEALLFNRFGDFFRYAYDVSLSINSDQSQLRVLEELLDIHEPQEIGLGYTEDSHGGSGPGRSFARQLLHFFIHSSAKRLIKEEGLYPDGRFNPVTLEIFIDKLGPDGISDITANLIMDYLIEYTQKQCQIYSVPLTNLPVRYDGFDFQEMEWFGGGYHDLPENPSIPGTPVILVPKRFLRAPELGGDAIESKVKGILNQDPELTRRFSTLINKKVSDIDINDVRKVFLEEDSVFEIYLKSLSELRAHPYNFEKDILKILSIKSYSHFFDKLKIKGEVNSCDELLVKVHEFIGIVKDHISRADGWRDMWVGKGKGKDPQPAKEAVFGRMFRAMGYAYFQHFPEVTFEPEVNMGSGPVDFKIIYKGCRVVIELKKVANSSPTGEEKIPAYLHGIKVQLPDYAYLSRASHAIYITLQHYTPKNRPKNHHDARVEEIDNLVETVEAEMKETRTEFKKLEYINIICTPKESSSKK